MNQIHDVGKGNEVLCVPEWNHFYQQNFDIFVHFEALNATNVQWNLKHLSLAGINTVVVVDMKCKHFLVIKVRV